MHRLALVRRKPFISNVLVASLIVNIGSLAQASLTTFTDLSSWSAAAGSSGVLEDFNNQTTESFGSTYAYAGTPNPFEGFTLSGELNGGTAGIFDGTLIGNIDGTTYLGWNDREQLGGDMTANGAPTMTFNFDNPVTAFAFQWTDTDGTDEYEVNIGGTLFSDPPFGDQGSHTPITGFWGVVETDPANAFTTAVFTLKETGGGLREMGIDNVRTVANPAVPEPSSLAV